MVKTRVEVNENGEFFIILPEEVVADCGYDEGDQLELDSDDPEFVILSIA